MIFKEYATPAAGYKGWIEDTEGTIVGFVKVNGLTTDW